jgi:Sulfotransferase family
MLRDTRAFFSAAETEDLQALEARKIEQIRHFDVAGMQKAVAICACGPSGSLLLTSCLDGHDGVIMLPNLRGQAIYFFFERYPSLSLREKLTAYAFLFQFFEGEDRIATADYYAAVNALFQVYGGWPPEFLESRRAFFQFLHVVYCVALGRLPVSPRPLIVYQQHVLDDELGRRFVEDFPQACFIHTVRDPITNCGRQFHYFLKFRGFLAPAYTISLLTFADMPHPGLESRTLTIRFEDLHLRLEDTMRAVADWLGLAYQSSLLDSTFNGVPFVVGRGTITWSGPRAEQAMRDSRNVSFTDRYLLGAVLYEDFLAWGYPCPRMFGHAAVRVLTCMLTLLIPMKMEIITARTLIKLLPSSGLRSFANGLVRICICRIAIMSLLAVELYRRLVFGKQVLRISMIAEGESSSRLKLSNIRAAGELRVRPPA